MKFRLLFSKASKNLNIPFATIYGQNLCIDRYFFIYHEIDKFLKTCVYLYDGMYGLTNRSGAGKTHFCGNKSF